MYQSMSKSPQAASSSKEWKQDLEMVPSYLEKAKQWMNKHADQNRHFVDYQVGDKAMGKIPKQYLFVRTHGPHKYALLSAPAKTVMSKTRMWPLQVPSLDHLLLCISLGEPIEQEDIDSFDVQQTRRSNIVLEIITEHIAPVQPLDDVVSNSHEAGSDSSRVQQPYAEAVADSMWVAVKQEGITALGNNHTWEIVASPKRKKVASGYTRSNTRQWVYKHDPVPVGSSPQRLAPFGAAPSICRLTWPTYKQLFWRTFNPWISSICAPGGGYGHTRPLPWPEHCHRMHSPILKLDIASCMCTWPLLRPSRATLNPWPLSQASFLDMPSHVLWHSQT
ncbi:hypothetical protein FXO37_26449 [Capsicum annuum]|nr:hypothetical protein FXO37_26449 [Capsicum annuum]